MWNYLSKAVLVRPGLSTQQGAPAVCPSIVIGHWKFVVTLQKLVQQPSREITYLHDKKGCVALKNCSLYNSKGYLEIDLMENDLSFFRADVIYGWSPRRR